MQSLPLFLVIVLLLTLSILSAGIITPLQDTPILPPANLRVNLEASNIAGTGATLRFTFLTLPTYKSFTVGYENDQLGLNGNDGCQLFDYVPLNSFYSPNWDETHLNNCFLFSSWELIGRVIINTDNCKYNNVFSFEFIYDSIDKIIERVQIDTMIECYLISATEPTFADVPFDPDNGNDRPFIMVSENHPWGAQSDQKTTNNISTTTTKKNKFRIIDNNFYNRHTTSLSKSIKNNQIATLQTTPIIQSYTLQTLQNLTIYNPPDITFRYNLPVPPITPQVYIDAVSFQELFSHHQERISIFEVWFLKIPPSSSIPIGLYQDDDLEINLLEDYDMMMIQERIENEKNQFFNFQCVRNIARLHVPIIDPITMEPIKAPGTGLGMEYPTTRTFLNTQNLVEQTFMCQFVFKGVSQTQNYTFVFGDEIRTNIIRPALDLKNKIVNIVDEYVGKLPLLNNDPINGIPIIPEPLIVFQAQINDDSAIIFNNTLHLTQTDPHIPTELLYYTFKHTISFQFPIRIVTNQTFILKLDHPSQQLVRDYGILIDTVPISNDIDAVMTNIDNLKTFPPYPPRPYPDEHDEGLSNGYNPDDISPGQITIKYLTKLPREWNEFYGVWNRERFEPIDTEYIYQVPPPVPAEVSNQITVIDIFTRIPVNSSINFGQEKGFNLYYTLSTHIKQENHVNDRRTIIYNPSNPLQLSYRPTINMNGVNSPQFDTVLGQDKTNHQKWTYQINFKMDQNSLSSSPDQYTNPEVVNNDYINQYQHEEYGYLDEMPPDGLYITGFYTTPISASTIPDSPPIIKPSKSRLIHPNNDLNRAPSCKLLIQTQIDLIPTIQNPDQIRPMGNIIDNGVDFEPQYTFVQGKYWRVGIPIFTYYNTDEFFIQCEQKLNPNLKSKEQNNAVILTTDLVAHPRRWYQETSLNTRKFHAKIVYPAETLSDEYLIPQILHGQVAFLLSGPNITTSNEYKLYHQAATYMIKNMLYEGPELTGTVGLTNINYPFFNIEDRDLYLTSPSQRQEWTRSYNHIGLRSLNYHSYTPFDSFSIFTPNKNQTGALIFLLNDVYFDNYAINLSQFVNNNLDFKYHVDESMPNNPDTTPNNDDLALFRLTMLDIIPISDPKYPKYSYFPQNSCQLPGFNITRTPIHPACPAAIGQNIHVVTQCPFDVFGSVWKNDPARPLYTPMTTTSHQSLYDGLTITECGQKGIQLEEFQRMESFWGRHDNGASSFGVIFYSFGFLMFIMFL
jgi:hypothetical protein